MPDGKAFRFGYAVIIILVIIFLAMKVNVIFTPIVLIVQTLAAPIIISGVLYYVLRPFERLLSKKLPRWLSIVLIYLAAVGAIVLFIFLIGPPLQRQVNSLIQNTPAMLNEIRIWFINLEQHEWVQRFQGNEAISLEELSRHVTAYLREFLTTIGASIADLISAITNFFIVLFLIPFVLFFMLKDGDKLPKKILMLLPDKQKGEGERILKDLDSALSSYIQGQLIVSACVGILVYIGYLIIGLDYSLVLGLIAMFTSVIPFIGPIIGTIPGVIVAIIDSPMMVVKVLIVVIVAQQIEGNLISPFVMGKKLEVHPLTIIFLLLVAGSFAGLVGLLIAVPMYAVAKVVVRHTLRLIKLWRENRELVK